MGTHATKDSQAESYYTNTEDLNIFLPSEVRGKKVVHFFLLKFSSFLGFWIKHLMFEWHMYSLLKPLKNL